MGRPLPGYDVVLVDPVDGDVRPDGPAEGEICLRLDPPELGRPLGLMVGYRDDDERTAEAMRGGVYHTGDVASRDADGYITYVGRADDVFKASDYRISPFELESVLVEHPAVAEAAVVPVAGPAAARRAEGLRRPRGRLGADGRDGGARSSAYAREHLAPYKRIRRLEFAELPKTISGKIRRVELRADEQRRHPDGTGDARRPGVLGGRPALRDPRSSTGVRGQSAGSCATGRMRDGGRPRTWDVSARLLRAAQAGQERIRRSGRSSSCCRRSSASCTTVPVCGAPTSCMCPAKMPTW